MTLDHKRSVRIRQPLPKKYLVLGGGVISSTDGQRHYISAHQLMRLYGVRPNECLLVDENRPEMLAGIDRSKYTVLRPRSDGNYQRAGGQEV